MMQCRVDALSMLRFASVMYCEVRRESPKRLPHSAASLAPRFLFPLFPFASTGARNLPV